MAWTTILKNLARAGGEEYRVGRLIDTRQRGEGGAMAGGRQLVCDIDKTYLETEFESLVRMARIAFEAATDKITVAGASDVLLAARWGDVNAPLASEQVPRPLHFVSSSPPQLRAVLEEKLMLDGLDWSTDTFKDQAYNLRRRRMDLLRQHVAYKSLAILRLLIAAGAGARFALIGDNAESDSFIYIGVKLVASGRLSPDAYRRFLEAAGVEPKTAEDVATEAAPLAAGDGALVDVILIRNVPGYQFVRIEPLTDPVQTFDNFFQAALQLMVHGIVPPETLVEVTRRFHNRHGMPRAALRSMIAPIAADGGALGEAARATLDRLGGIGPPGLTAAAAGFVLRPRDATGFDALSEAQILDAARRWHDRMKTLYDEPEA